jgi:hypothetical protein
MLNVVKKGVMIGVTMMGVVMLNVIMLSVIMLSVVMLNVIFLSAWHLPVAGFDLSIQRLWVECSTAVLPLLI